MPNRCFSLFFALDDDSVEQLELISNKFSGAELKHLGHLSSLKSLSLGENSIRTFEELRNLEELKEIVQLDLDSTPLKDQNKESYSKKIFGMFPNLKVLDNLDKEGKEFQYEDIDGSSNESDDDEDPDDEEGDDDDKEFDEDDDEDFDEDEEEEEEGEEEESQDD